jgi:hypothetical protein
MIRLVLVTVAMSLVTITATQADAAITEEPTEHKCYAVLSRLGSKPVQVPCDKPQPPAPPVEEAPEVEVPVEPPCEVSPTPPAVPSPPIHQRRRHHHRHHHR